MAGTSFLLDGKFVTSMARLKTRVSDVLRDDFGLTGTKVGCNAAIGSAPFYLMVNRSVVVCRAGAN